MQSTPALISSAFANRGYREEYCSKPRVINGVAEEGTVEIPAGTAHFVPRSFLDRLYKPEIFYNVENNQLFVERPNSAMLAIAGVCMPVPNWDRMPLETFMKSIDSFCGRVKTRPATKPGRGFLHHFHI